MFSFLHVATILFLHLSLRFFSGSLFLMLVLELVLHMYHPGKYITVRGAFPRFVQMLPLYPQPLPSSYTKVAHQVKCYSWHSFHYWIVFHIHIKGTPENSRLYQELSEKRYCLHFILVPEYKPDIKKINKIWARRYIA